MMVFRLAYPLFNVHHFEVHDTSQVENKVAANKVNPAVVTLALIVLHM